MAAYTGPIVLGVNGAVEQIPEYSESILDGRLLRRRWVGSVFDAIGVYNQLRKSAITTGINRISLTPFGSAKAQVVAEYTQPSFAATIQLVSQEDVESIFLNPTFIAIPPSVVNTLEFQKTLSPSATLTKDLQTAISNSGWAIDMATALALCQSALNLLRVGDDSFRTHHFSLTRTFTVERYYSNRSFMANAFAQIDKIFSSAQLVAWIGDPIVFDLPPLLVSDIERANWNLWPGWLKTAVEVTDIANGCRNILERWEQAKWSLFDYALLP